MSLAPSDHTKQPDNRTTMELGAVLPMTAEVQEILQWLHNHEGGQKDHSAIAQYYEYLTGIKLGR